MGAEKSKEAGLRRDIITVDGVGASGKSALSKLLAQKLGYGHLNSGLLYRAAGYLVLREGRDPSRSEDVLRVLDNHTLELERNAQNGSVIVVDGEPIDDAVLNSAEVSSAASFLAQHESVRERFFAIQRSAFAPLGVVAEGRDMGTVIFPEARIKFFVDARLDVRAHRRFLQLKGTPQERPLEEISKTLAERDERDSNRAVAPMKPAEGAVVIDNSDVPLEETVERMLRIVRG